MLGDLIVLKLLSQYLIILIEPTSHLNWKGLFSSRSILEWSEQSNHGTLNIDRQMHNYEWTWRWFSSSREIGRGYFMTSKHTCRWSKLSKNPSSILPFFLSKIQETLKITNSSYINGIWNHAPNPPTCISNPLLESIDVQC